jgi:hypothetical protein
MHAGLIAGAEDLHDSRRRQHLDLAMRRTRCNLHWDGCRSIISHDGMSITRENMDKESLEARDRRFVRWYLGGCVAVFGSGIVMVIRGHDGFRFAGVLEMLVALVGFLSQLHRLK